MTDLLNKDVTEMLSDAQYWMEVEKRLGWRLIGFTFRMNATFVDKHDDVVTLTGNQRDDILCTSSDPNNHQGDTCPVHEL